MAENNQLIEKPKLNFFQRIRKAMLMFNIDAMKYRKAPDYLRYDDDVIEALVAKRPIDFAEVGASKKIEIVEKIPGLFEKLAEDQKVAIVEQKEEFASRMQEFELENLIFGKEQDKYIKYIPLNLQVNYLTKGLIYINNDWARSKTEQEEISPEYFRYKLPNFSEEALEEAFTIMVEQAKNSPGENWKEKRENVPLLAKSTDQISKFSPQLQEKIATMDSEFMKEISDEVKDKFISDNPMLLDKMGREYVANKVRENPDFFDLLTAKQKGDLLYYYDDLRTKLPLQDIIEYNYKKTNVSLAHDDRISDSEVIKNWMLKNDRLPGNMANLVGLMKGGATVLEVARFQPTVLSTNGLSFKDQKVERLKPILEFYSNLTNSQEIKNACNVEEFTNVDMNFIDVKSRNVPKVLLNERVMRSVPSTQIADFIRNPDMDKMVDIIAKTYGEQTREIFRDRPGLTMDEIPTLDIFDEKVVEKFGIGTVHNALSYNSAQALVIGDLVRHPEKMRDFEMFSKAMGDKFENSVLGLEDKMISYFNFQDLMKDVKPEDITPERQEKLQMAVNDFMMTKGTNETTHIKLENLEDLDNYTQTRNEIYDKFVEKVSTPEDVKEAISRKFFGMPYIGEHDAEYNRNALSLKGMSRYYNLETFTSDERTQNSGMFTNDELDQLELATIIDKIDDPDVLKEIYSTLSSREDVIRPHEFSKIREKVPRQYSKELVDTLLTVDKAKEMIERGEEGISYSIDEDGIETIRLSGADFRLLVHTTGLNNSNLSIGKNDDAAKIWNEFENGCSTVSACYIEPNVMSACANPEGFNFGFANVPEKQVIGMAPRDAHVDHTVRKADPKFSYGAVEYNYPEEMLRRTAAQITGIESKDLSHEYNEVTMFRREMEADKIENGSKGGKMMPDYLVVYGEVTDQQRMMAKNFMRDGKPLPIIQIDTKAYINNMEYRATYRENHKQDREKGNIVSDVNKMKSDGYER